MEHAFRVVVDGELVRDPLERAGDLQHGAGVPEAQQVLPEVRVRVLEHFLAEAGLAAPRTDLVEVAINGDPLGLAALIELPSPELLESSGRNAAPVVSFDTSAYWKALRDNGRTGPFDNPSTAAITAAPNPEDRDARTAVALLRGFLRGDLPANEVFDVPATARWLAYAELWGDASSVHWTRARFYLDGLTARLAPIPALPRTVLAVGEVPDPATRTELITPRTALGSRLLDDSAIRQNFARELRLLAAQLGVDDLGHATAVDAATITQHTLAHPEHRLVPTLELFLLLQLGALIGPIYTFVIVVITGIIGSWLARMEGWSVLGQLRDDLQQGIPPASRIAEGVLVLIGGVLLVTPGVLTDLFGFSLMIPITRRFMAPRLIRYLGNRFQIHATVGPGRPINPNAGPAKTSEEDPKFQHPDDHPFSSPFDDLP